MVVKHLVAPSGSIKHKLLRVLTMITVVIVANHCSATAAVADSLERELTRKITVCKTVITEWSQLVQLINGSPQRSCDLEQLTENFYTTIDSWAFNTLQSDKTFRRKLSKMMTELGSINAPRFAAIAGDLSTDTSNQESKPQLRTVPGYFTSDE